LVSTQIAKQANIHKKIWGGVSDGVLGLHEGKRRFLGFGVGERRKTALWVFRNMAILRHFGRKEVVEAEKGKSIARRKRLNNDYSSWVKGGRPGKAER